MIVPTYVQGGAYTLTYYIPYIRTRQSLEVGSLARAKAESLAKVRFCSTCCERIINIQIYMMLQFVHVLQSASLIVSFF